jgi:hypothetical protein
MSRKTYFESRVSLEFIFNSLACPKPARKQGLPLLLTPFLAEVALPHGRASDTFVCNSRIYPTLITFVIANSTNDMAAAYPKLEKRNAVR